MNLQTKIPLAKAANQIGYDSQLLLLGSCFVENMGKQFDYFQFQSLQNPFGILFHPLAIEKLISKAIRKESYLEEDIFYLNERWHCFDAHSDLSDTSPEKLLQKLNQGLETTNQQIGKSTHLILTLGTAWVYRKKNTETIVANCHKAPQGEFSKEILSVSQIQKSIEKIIKLVRSINENVQFVFTISPVRHLKEGFVENQRGKAHLIAAVQQTLKTSNLVARTSYFESYEILMDELRDYRFYEADMVHPNQLAIEYIWKKFKHVWISEKAYATIEKVDAVQKGLRHRPFNPDSIKHQQFLKSLETKITYLQEKYPFMDFQTKMSS